MSFKRFIPQSLWYNYFILLNIIESIGSNAQIGLNDEISFNQTLSSYAQQGQRIFE